MKTRSTRFSSAPHRYLQSSTRPAGATCRFPASAAAELFAQAGYRELPITWHHAAMVDTLPTIHGDPFDRILIAQALTEPMRLLSRDATLASYGVIVMPV